MHLHFNLGCNTFSFPLIQNATCVMLFMLLFALMEQAMYFCPLGPH